MNKIKKIILQSSFAAALALFALPSPATAQVIVVAPPRPPLVRVPPRPAPGYVWVGGYYAWRGGRYVWVAGYWAHPPRPAVIWVPGHWQYVSARRSYVWAPGYWR